MNFVAVDDEPRALHMLEILLEQFDSTVDVHPFLNPADALEYLQNNAADIAFMDVEMPDMSGFELADKLLCMPDPPAVVFLTGHGECALSAWDVEALDYILKPYSMEQLKRAVERYLKKYRPLRSFADRRCINIRCFPNFDVYIDGKPMIFRHRKSKELLAFLVHNRGAWVSVDKITFALFEENGEDSAKNYYRGVLYRLRQMLMENGIPELIQTAYGKCRVDEARFSCDFYTYIEGGENFFPAEYMSEYSWAEETTALLQAGR